MGCSHDCININLKTEEMTKKAIRLFGELLEEDLKTRFFNDDEMNIKETEDGLWFYIDEEPLFNNWDAGESINYFVKEFIKRYSGVPVFMIVQNAKNILRMKHSHILKIMKKEKPIFVLIVMQKLLLMQNNMLKKLSLKIFKTIR